MKLPFLVSMGLFCLLVTQGSQALETDYGKVSGDFRLRYESAEQDNVLKDAEATTLRARIGFTSKDWSGMSFGIEGEAVKSAGNDYNSGPNGNGRTHYSVIPDTEDEEVNQLWVGYSGVANTHIKFGRQRLVFDNARFVGNVGWRQNEQTYDGFSVQNSTFSNTTFSYAYIVQVNDIFFRDRELKGHLLNAKYSYAQGIVGAYSYFLDFDQGAGPDQRTHGLRAEGQLYELNTLKFAYRAEYAVQQDYADANSFKEDYSLIELAVNQDDLGLLLGIEALEGDGNIAFQTPLATLHAFNGWADQFLSTPAHGLVDRYVGASYKLAGVVLKAFYHHYVSDTGNIDHGQEWNVLVAYKPALNWSLLAKLADYKADATSVDTEKLWLQVGYVF